MKVDGINPGIKKIANNKTDKSTTGLDFQQMLEKQVSQTAKVAPVAGVNQINPTTAVSAHLKTDGLQLSEATINTLDSFAAALNNQKLSIDDLEPFAAALEDDTLALLAVRDKLPADDSLGSLLERVATVSFVEATKYRQGYYS